MLELTVIVICLIVIAIIITIQEYRIENLRKELDWHRKWLNDIQQCDIAALEEDIEYFYDQDVKISEQISYLKGENPFDKALIEEIMEDK